jgi:hypothetical protein
MNFGLEIGDANIDMSKINNPTPQWRKRNSATRCILQ